MPIGSSWQADGAFGGGARTGGGAFAALAVGRGWQVGGAFVGGTAADGPSVEWLLKMPSMMSSMSSMSVLVDASQVGGSDRA